MMGRIALTVVSIALAVPALGETIRGEYLEARNADVWTGPCFANAEIGIVGNRAVLAWKVTDGKFDGVKLNGLGVAAVVMGDSTFGIGEEVKTKTVFLVDEQADELQSYALVAMAKKLAGSTIQDVVAVHKVKFNMQTSLCTGMGCARLDAGQAKIVTRCMKETDCICGHETLAYAPLSKVEQEYAAYSLENEYKGSDLGVKFQDSNARSAMIGGFSL